MPPATKPTKPAPKSSAPKEPNKPTRPTNPRVRVKRTEFLEVLARVEAGLAKRESMEQATCYAFTEGWVVTYNDEICCRTKSGLPKEFLGVVPSKPLKDVLNNLSDEDLSIAPTDKEFVIRAGEKEIRLRMQAEVLLPLDEVSIPQDWVELPEDFTAAITAVVHAAATSDEEFITRCVHIHPDYIEATDRRQMARYTFVSDPNDPDAVQGSGVSQSFLIRADSLAQVLHLGVTLLGETEEWVHLRNQTVVFSCRRHLEDYFELDDQFAFEGTPAVLPQGGEEAAKIAGTFCEGKNDKVLVRLTDGKMTVEGRSTFGSATVPLAMSYHGADAAFSLLPAMLVHLIKKYTNVELDQNKLRVNGEKWVYITGLGSANPPKGDDVEDIPDEEGGDDGDAD